MFKLMSFGKNKTACPPQKPLGYAYRSLVSLFIFPVYNFHVLYLLVATLFLVYLALKISKQQELIGHSNCLIEMQIWYQTLSCPPTELYQNPNPSVLLTGMIVETWYHWDKHKNSTEWDLLHVQIDKNCHGNFQVCQVYI